MLYTTTGRVNLAKDSQDQRIDMLVVAMDNVVREAIVADMGRLELNPFAMPAIIGQPTGPLVRV